jgi:hypothetical protein
VAAPPAVPDFLTPYARVCHLVESNAVDVTSERLGGRGRSRAPHATGEAIAFAVSAAAGW